MAFTETVEGTGGAVGVPVRLGKYTLLSRLASGGMGEVYVAQMAGAAGFEKLVVIKRLLPQLVEDENFVRMFLEEARITAQLNHPNVCQVFELGENAGEYFISMEYLEGLPLSQLLQRYAAGGLDVRIAAGLMAQACEGLAHAHEFHDPFRGIDGVVHRDVSPQNLFMTTAGLVKVLDFGVAKLYREGSKTVTQSAKGKYLYMSPEQVQGEPVDRRSDIFALGVVLFELITGRNLFRRATEFQTLQAIITGDRPRVSDFRTDVPQAVSDVVERALSVSRNQRYGSARSLAEALNSAVAPLGGPASITELSEFIRREHRAEIAGQRERIRRAFSQLQTFGEGTGQVQALDSVTPPRARTSAPNLRHSTPLPWGVEQQGEPDPGRVSSVLELAPSGRVSSVLELAPSGRVSSVLELAPSGRVSSVLEMTAAGRPSSVLEVVGEDGRRSSVSIVMNHEDMAELLRAQRRGYVRWGIVAGAALAIALWSGRHWFLGPAKATATPPVLQAVNVPAAPASAAAAADQPATTAATTGVAAGVAAGAAADRPAQAGKVAAPDEVSAAAGAGAVPDADKTESPGSESAARSAGADAPTSGRKSVQRQDARDDDKRRDDGGDESDDAQGKPGYFTIDAKPYAEVFVNGRSLGVTPLVRVPLAAGRHSIRAVSPGGEVKRLTIRIKPGRSETRRITF